MAISDKRRRIARLLLRRLRIAGLLLLVALLASGVWGIYQKERESRELRGDAERELSELTERENQLRQGIARLGSERGMEEALRDQYTVGRPGERLIIVVEPERREIATTSSPFYDWVHKLFPFW